MLQGRGRGDRRPQSGGGKSTFLRCHQPSRRVRMQAMGAASTATLLGVSTEQWQPCVATLSDAALSQPAPPGRHGVPAVQFVEPHDGARQRHGKPRSWCKKKGREKGTRSGPRAIEMLAQGRHCRQGRRLSGTAFRRPAAAGGHRPGPSHPSRRSAVRRADLGARSGDGRRGAAGDAGPLTSRA